MARLTVNELGYRQILCETNVFGEVVEWKKAKATHVLVRCKLVIAEGELEFHVHAKVPKALSSDERTAEAISVAWLRQELPRQMSRTSYWDFFQYTELTAESGEGYESIDLNRDVGTELALDSGLLVRAQQAIAHLALQREKFEAAKEELWGITTNSLPPGFGLSRGEAWAALDVLERVLTAGADMGNVRGEDARAARKAYDDLVGRKDPNRPGYKMSLESLTRFIHLAYFPSTWHTKPAA